MRFIHYELKKDDYNVELAASNLALKQVNKFNMYGSFYGDNTSILLVDLTAKFHELRLEKLQVQEQGGGGEGSGIGSGSGKDVQDNEIVSDDPDLLF